MFIIGLGNPDDKYVNTWHNLGFKVLDKIVSDKGMSYQIGRGQFIFSSKVWLGHKVMLFKPSTYMNLSGNAVLNIINYYKCKPEDILVIYDDISLELGQLRLRLRGSAGGHNGVKSIIDKLQTDNFPRLKLGFRTPEISNILNYRKDALADIVLSRIPVKYQENIDCLLEKSITMIEDVLKYGYSRSMSLHNT